MSAGRQSHRQTNTQTGSWTIRDEDDPFGCCSNDEEEDDEKDDDDYYSNLVPIESSDRYSKLDDRPR